MDCIFCRIIAKEIPSKIIAETSNILVIQDRVPSAPIHYLIIPKKHISDIAALTQDDVMLAGSLLLMAKTLSEQDVRASAFKLAVNNGAAVGQSVFHVHVHFLAGFSQKPDHLI